MLDVLSKDIIDHLKVTVPDEKKCLVMLLDGRDAKLKLAVFKLIEAVGSVEYKEMVRPFLNSHHEKIREQAVKILGQQAKTS